MAQGSRSLDRLVAAFLLLLLNSAYLAAFASSSLFYFGNVVAHVVGGTALAAAFVRVLRRDRPRPRSLLVRWGLWLLAIGALAGFGIAVVGATRPFRWLLSVHMAASIVGATVLACALAVRLRSVTSARRRWALATALALVAASAVASAIARTGHQSRLDAQYTIRNPARVPISMDEEGAGPAGPFFPSSAETNVGGIVSAGFLMTSENCGRCHRDIYEQWRASAHHFSSFNNQWYRKSVEYMQDVVGTRPSRWCAGCHDHAVFFNGRFDRPIREQVETPEAQAGLGCASCHAITHVKSTMGQGDFVIEYPPLHDLAASENRLVRAAHDYLLRIDPQPHRETFLKPFHRNQTPEFCAACHKVHLDVPVNSYRWIRGFNEYDNWQASGVSGEGARSFYYPAAPQRCADCHMPRVASNDPAAKNGRIRSHRFPGANTALPYVNRDWEQLRITQDFLRDGQISMDIFGLVRTPEPSTREIAAAAREPELSTTFAQGEESLSASPRIAAPPRPGTLIAPLDRVAATVRRGESVRIETVVRTRKVGHFFPGGTVDAFDVWVELEAIDDRGRTIFHSGAVERDGAGPVEPGAHFYRSLLLDEHGNPINKRNAWMARSVAYVRLIPPGAADTAHYRLDIPEDCGDTMTLRAKVNYRKFAWWNTQWAFAGVRDPDTPRFSLGPGHDDGPWIFSGDTSRVSGEIKAIPDIPITVMASAEVTLRVLPADAPVAPSQPVLDPTVRERWNDYGIGLLLQGDLKGAEAVFLKVTEMDPAYADGWVNVARARIQEGDMTGAETMLRNSLTIDPTLAKTHFFLGLALKGLGRYDEALTHLETAAARYPRDRVVLNQIGRVLFLKRRYADAVQRFAQVLAIDPEDLQAHYNLMLSYQGLGRLDLAAHEEKLYRRFKADEAAQTITGPFRALHPHDNNERQPVHEHRSIPLRLQPAGSGR